MRAKLSGGGGAIKRVRHAGLSHPSPRAQSKRNSLRIQ